MDRTELVIGFCTVPDRDAALRMARTLVTEELAACVNVVPNVTSIYRWHGAVEESSEWLLLIKTTRAVSARRLKDRVLTLHPYDVPELLLVPVTSGLDKYVAWASASVRGGDDAA